MPGILSSVVTTKMFQTLQSVSWVAKLPSVKNQWVRQQQKQQTVGKNVYKWSQLHMIPKTKRWNHTPHYTINHRFSRMPTVENQIVSCKVFSFILQSFFKEPITTFLPLQEYQSACKDLVIFYCHLLHSSSRCLIKMK